MKNLTVFLIVLLALGERNSFIRAMKPTTNRKCVPTTPTTDHVLDGMDTDGLSTDFQQLNVSSPSTSGQYVSIDDGYYSQSIKSGDFLCIVGGCEEKEERVDNVSFHDNMTTSDDETNQTFEQHFTQNSDGDTDLHLALIQGREMMAMWLISLVRSSAWLNIPNRLLQTPLHIAVIVKDAIAVRRLMTAGARLDVRDVNGNTPLHVACREGLIDIVSCLLRPVTYTETLQNKYDLTYQRIPQDLELPNYDGFNCLHLAAMATHLRVLDLLISRGANPNSKEHKSGRTVLHQAAERNDLELIVYLLRQRRVDVNAENYGGMTPLRLAAGRNHTTVMELLLSCGAYDGYPDDSYDG